MRGGRGQILIGFPVRCVLTVGTLLGTRLRHAGRSQVKDCPRASMGILVLRELYRSIGKLSRKRAS